MIKQTDEIMTIETSLNSSRKMKASMKRTNRFKSGITFASKMSWILWICCGSFYILYANADTIRGERLLYTNRHWAEGERRPSSIATIERASKPLLDQQQDNHLHPNVQLDSRLPQFITGRRANPSNTFSSNAEGSIPSFRFPSESDAELDSDRIQSIRDHRSGRVLNTVSTSYHEEIGSNSSKNSSDSRESQQQKPLENADGSGESSRKASPDVQDIIDGIVKLLGGKVHNGTPGQGQGQRPNQPLSSPNPAYNLFNPTKPIFFPTSKATPTRINNRGPPLPISGATGPSTSSVGYPPSTPPYIYQNQNQNQNQNYNQKGSGETSSFEAIPLEALNSEFNLNKTNYGPPFPLNKVVPSGGVGVGIEAPYKKGVPLPQQLVPSPSNGNRNGNNNNGQYLNNNNNPYPLPLPGNNIAYQNNNNNPYQNPYNYNQNPINNYNPNYNNYGSTLLNPGGFSTPTYNGNSNGNSNNKKPVTSTQSLLVPVQNQNQNQNYLGQNKPTERPIFEDDEEDELRFTTNANSENKPNRNHSGEKDKDKNEGNLPHLPSKIGNGQTSNFIRPTPTLDIPGENVYPTLVLETNSDNGLVEIVTKYSTISPTRVPPSPSMTPTASIRFPDEEYNDHHKHLTSLSSSSSTTPGSGFGGNTNNDGAPFGGLSSSTTSGGVISSTLKPLTSSLPQSIHSFPTPPLRPGIVISDTPPRAITSVGQPQGVGSVEVVTALDGQESLGEGQVGEIFDVTVTAKQSYGGQNTGQPFVVPVDLKDDVITAPKGNQQFVSIDGKRTYFNLHPNTATATAGIVPSPSTQTVIGTILPVLDGPLAPVSKPMENKPKNPSIGVGSVGAPVPLLPGKTLFNSNTPVRPVSTSLSIQPGSGAGLNDKGIISKTPPNLIRRPLTRRPTSPPVRIDTCIVGDDSTCNSEQYEVCRTENGVSSCVCRAGYARRRHREPCKAILSLVMSIKLDKMGDKKLSYNPDYFNPNSDIYQTIEWETIHALDSSMSETTLSGGYVGAKLDAIGFDGKHAVVNTTILIQDNPKMPPNKLKLELQKQMIQVLTRNRNNFGKSQLWVEGPISAVSAITDLDECEESDMNDCHSKAHCINTLGSFECRCEPGYGDPHEMDKRRSGRRCDSCSGKSHCNSRGECLIENGQKVCKCSGNYYGSQCDIDGEVLAVAIGASVSAVVIIGLTLACLCMWSRRWKKEEQKAALMSRTLFGGMATQALSYLGGKSTNPYQQHVSMDERLRWAQVADSNMTGNIYVQNDPMSMHTSPTLMMDTPPMMSTRRSAESADTTSEDLFDERQQTKRPRSRALSQSQLQGGIYYDLEPDAQNEIYASRSMMHFPPAQFCVPMTPMGHYAHSSRGFYT